MGNEQKHASSTPNLGVGCNFPTYLISHSCCASQKQQGGVDSSSGSNLQKLPKPQISPRMYRDVSKSQTSNSSHFVMLHPRSPKIYSMTSVVKICDLLYVKQQAPNFPKSGKHHDPLEPLQSFQENATKIPQKIMMSG